MTILLAIIVRQVPTFFRNICILSTSSFSRINHSLNSESNIGIGVDYMNPFIEQIVIQRMNQLTPGELYQYASQYNIPVTKQQASNIAMRVQNKNINPFKPDGQQTLRKILNEEIGTELSEILEKQFEHLAKGL